jgi:lipopolysaccharide export system permease protein
MYYRVAFVPGGQAIGALESVFSKLVKRLRKLFERKRPRQYADFEPAPAE